MAISESQLETWSKQGSVTQSADTYEPIRKVLQGNGTPYAVANTDCHLQGSYGNNTNVYAESDVDIVMQYTPVWIADLSRLSAQDLAAYNREYTGANAFYGYSEFRRDVFNCLDAKYVGIDPLGKAIKVPPNSGRRKADVLVAISKRRYYSFVNEHNQRFDPGVCFQHNGQWVENFPKQHRANCTTKHQNTKELFKPTVRIFKNMRSRLVEQHALVAGSAPSYFIEGLLYNVPDAEFKPTYSATVVACLAWILRADPTKLTTANGMHWLVRDGSPTSWPTANFSAYVNAMVDSWNRG